MTRAQFIADLLEIGTDDTQVVVSELDSYMAKREKYERYDSVPEPALRSDGKIQLNGI